jgi:hypothetical protein
MHVEVVRRGGIAGIALRGTVDTAELPHAGEAEAALRRLQFGRPPSPPRHPDGFQYEITVVDGDDRQSTVLDEAEVPAGLHPVIEAAVMRGRLG